MTTDIVVLATRPLGQDALVRALMAAGPALRVGALGAGVALQLFDDHGTLVTTMESPSYIQIPYEAERLIGLDDAPEPPYWWIELRSPTLRPTAVAAAMRLASSLVSDLDGVLWHST